MSETNQQLQSDQRGLVSFMVTMIMMLVISLIVIGFSQVTRRSEREALDRQLSTQAFYAAETGVNDAVSTIKTTVASGAQPVAKPTCDPSSAYTADPVLKKDASGIAQVSYSCLLVDTEPTTVSTTGQNQGSNVVHLTSSDAAGNLSNLAALSFNWNVDSGGNTSTAACHDTANAFPKASDWNCDFAVLRVDLLQVPGSPNSATALESRTVTGYFTPSNSDRNFSMTTFAAGSAQKAMILTASCTGSTCTGTLHFSGAASSTNYYARISTLYRNTSSINIKGTLGDGTAAHFSSYATIDVTGKAQDVLRRIQVKVPIDSATNSTIPSAALQTTEDLCKRYITATNVFSDQCGP